MQRNQHRGNDRGGRASPHKNKQPAEQQGSGQPHFLPLHKGITRETLQDFAFTSLVAQGHAGLLFDKFFQQWAWDEGNECIKIREPQKSKDKDDKGGKAKWLGYFVKEGIGKPEQLNEALARRTRLINSRSGEQGNFTTEGRFVAGMGRAHPVENGFAWHPTLGVPYLPGSSVKGLVRSWLEGGWGDSAVITEDDRKNFHRVFGSDFARESEFQGKFGHHDTQVGSVLFLDALPTVPIRLEVDIMTPHYGPYYSGKEAPGDWHNPVPVLFLTVAPGQTFQFAVLPRTVNDQADAKQALHWLESALRHLGAGGKTNSGYGRMVREGGVSTGATP